MHHCAFLLRCSAIVFILSWLEMACDRFCVPCHPMSTWVLSYTPRDKLCADTEMAWRDTESISCHLESAQDKCNRTVMHVLWGTNNAQLSFSKQIAYSASECKYNVGSPLLKRTPEVKIFPDSLCIMYSYCKMYRYCIPSPHLGGCPGPGQRRQHVRPHGVCPAAPVCRARDIQRHLQVG